MITASICPWKNDKDAAVSMTFDDGLASQAELAAPILHELGINGTFFITIDNVGIPFGANWTQWQKVGDMGHEISSHTITHPDMRTLTPEELEYEVVECKRIIAQNLSGADCQTFCYPYGYYDDDVISFVAQHHISARADPHNITPPPVPEKTNPSNMYAVVPCSFGSHETATYMRSLLDQAVGGKGWLVEMVHAIEGGGYDPVPLLEFRSHMEEIASRDNEVWVGTFEEVSKYILERQGSTLEVSYPDTDTAVIDIVSELDPSVFDLDLTVRIEVPFDHIDLVCMVNGHRTEFHPGPSENHRSFFMNAPIGSRIMVSKANIQPVISIIELEPGSGRPFAPMSGNSSTLFSFAISYLSEANRGPSEGPFCLLDLNSDGDMDDRLGGVIEGPRQMIKVDPMDLEYLDGCRYELMTSFPPGSMARISFLAIDTEGLVCALGEGLEGPIPGPIVNDPPSKPMDLALQDDHDPTPVFTWSRSADPDGNDLDYILELYLSNGTLQWSASTEDVSIEVERQLCFGSDYILIIAAMVGRGGLSPWASIEFELTNALPGAIGDLKVSYDRTLSPRLTFHQAFDPDGDALSNVVEIYDPQGNLISHMVLGDLIGHIETVVPIALSDHSDYSIDVWARDVYGLEGPKTRVDFRVNVPPLPLSHVVVQDAVGMEDALMISWSPSPDEDLGGYIIRRVEMRPIGPNGSLSTTDIDVGMNMSHLDQDVVDGCSYGYCVIPYDLERSYNEDGLSVFPGSPMDDVPPKPINGISVTDAPYRNRSITVQWNGSNDRRLAGYHIFRSDAEVKDASTMEPVALLPPNRGVCEWTDHEVQDDIRYLYVVSAFDGSGNEVLNNLTWVTGFSRDDASSANSDNDETHEQKNEGKSHITVMVSISAIVFVSLMVAFAYIIIKRWSTRHISIGITEEQ